jgi:hypothetical protein
VKSEGVGHSRAPLGGRLSFSLVIRHTGVGQLRERISSSAKAGSSPCSFERSFEGLPGVGWLCYGTLELCVVGDHVLPWLACSSLH